MNTMTPLSEIMTTNLITVTADAKLSKVKEIFDNKRIHHIPVIKYQMLIGIISKTDLLHYIKGVVGQRQDDVEINRDLLENYSAKDIMTTGIAKLESTDRIATAIEVFKENLFHAIPIVDNNLLVGIVTTYDIINFAAQCKCSAQEKMKNLATTIT